MIGNLRVEVDVNAASDVYFEKEVAEQLNGDGIGDITNLIYKLNGNTFMPLNVFLEMTDSCNFACPFCYINECGMIHSTLPRFDELKPTLDYLINNGMLYATLSGGECLLYPDFKDIYTYLKQSGVLVTVFTNGYLINDELIELFREYKPFRVEISLYGNDDDSYCRTVNRSDISAARVFNNVLKLRKAGINVFCKTLITSFTENTWEACRDWCAANDIPYDTGVELEATYSGVSRDEYKVSEGFYTKSRKASDREFFENEEMMALINGSESRRKLCFDCAAGKTELFVSAKYKLYPCMKAVGIDEWGFDIASEGIENACSDLRQQLEKWRSRPLQHCRGCRYHEVCQECFFSAYALEGEELAQHRHAYCDQLRTYIEAGPPPED